MAFIVRVPVLSLLITVVPPSVSTSVSDLTTALASASRCAPDDNINCTNVGRPVGMAEIAVDTHRTSVSVSWPRAIPKMAMTHRRPGQDPEELRQAVELTLERRLRALRRRDHVGDVAHLGRPVATTTDASPSSPGCSGRRGSSCRRAPSLCRGDRGVLGDRFSPVSDAS